MRGDGAQSGDTMPSQVLLVAPPRLPMLDFPARRNTSVGLEAVATSAHTPPALPCLSGWQLPRTDVTTTMLTSIWIDWTGLDYCRSGLDWIGCFTLTLVWIGLASF
jgi:hypothetical protein